MIPIPFSDDAMHDYRLHCLAEYPNEAVGYFLLDGTYQPVQNMAEDKRNCYLIGTRDRNLYADKAIGIGHSHTGKIRHPTAADIEFQVNTAIDHAVAHTDGQTVTTPIVWGPNVRVPLLERTWRWGPAGSDNKGDCWACVKDAVREYAGLDMRDVPRDANFWERGENLLNDWLPRLGWIPSKEPVLHGIATFSIGHKIEHHLGFIVNEVEMIHHLPPDGKHKSDRLSTIESIERFHRHHRRWWKHPGISG